MWHESDACRNGVDQNTGQALIVDIFVGNFSGLSDVCRIRIKNKMHTKGAKELVKAVPRPFPGHLELLQMCLNLDDGCRVLRTNQFDLDRIHDGTVQSLDGL